jgi:hypothetical protein
MAYAASLLKVADFLHATGLELYLDLIWLKQNFSKYLKEREKLGIRFNAVLKSVKLPDLHCDDEHKCHHKRGVRSTYEACDVFKYLLENNVRCIKEVRVPDCLAHPHSNFRIRECLSGFNIKRLDWRKHDFSLTLIREVAPGLQELKLYSSGNEDTLQFWATNIKEYLPSVSAENLSR